MNTWVDYIRDDIKAHIAAGRPLPARADAARAVGTLRGQHDADSPGGPRVDCRRLSLPPRERPADAQRAAVRPAGEEPAARAGTAPRLRRRDSPRPGGVQPGRQGGLRPRRGDGRALRREHDGRSPGLPRIGGGGPVGAHSPARLALRPFRRKDTRRLRPRPRTLGVGGVGRRLAAPGGRAAAVDLRGQRRFPAASKTSPGSTARCTIT